MNWSVAFLIICLFVSCQKNNDFDNEKEVLILPEYNIHEIVNKIDGNKYADILIPSFTPAMAIDSISKIAFAILKKEGLDEAAFYINVNAIKASYSSSFSNEHPDAFKEGYLGAITDNKFIPD